MEVDETQMYDLDNELEEEFDEFPDEFYDADEQYERWRDNWGDKLTEVLTDTLNMFVNCKDRGYYKGCKEKFVEHTIQTLLDLTDTHIVMSGKLISVRANEKVSQNTLQGFSKEQIEKAVENGLLQKEKTEQKENEIVEQLQRA